MLSKLDQMDVKEVYEFTEEHNDKRVVKEDKGMEG